MKKLLPLLLLALGFVACGPDNTIYEEHKDLSPKVEWLKADKREFKVQVDDNSIPYNLSLGLRYITGFRFDVAKVKVTETSPSGKKTVKEYDLKVRTDQGEYIGEPGLDIWDSTHPVETKKTYEEKGTYTYEIEHNMPTDPFTHVLQIGVIVDKVVAQ